MAGNKSKGKIDIDALEKSIKSKFGTKMPSNGNLEEELTREQLLHSQMIMGSLGALIWGQQSIKQNEQIKTLLGNKNHLFSLVKSIKENIDSINNVININNSKTYKVELDEKNVKSIIIEPLINGLKDSISSSIDINIDNLDQLNNLVTTLADGKSQINVYRGINTIIDLLKTLNSDDLKTLGKDAAQNLKIIKDLICGNKSILGDIFKAIGDIVGNKSIYADLRSLSIIIDTIIKILQIDPKTINVSGLRTLARITGPKGDISQLFTNLEEVTKHIKLTQSDFNVLQTFFESLTLLGDIGFIKRRRIRNNIAFIKKYIIGMIPEIVKGLQEVISENEKDAYTAINNLNSLFNALAEISNITIDRKLRLLINLSWVKNFYIKYLVDMLRKIQNVADENILSTSQALDSLLKVIEMTLKFGEIPMLKILNISIKTKLITAIVKTELTSLLESILSLKNIESALFIIEDLRRIFEYLDYIYNVTPSVLKSLTESVKLAILLGNISLFNELAKGIDKILIADLNTLKLSLIYDMLKVISDIYDSTPILKESLKESLNIISLYNNVLLIGKLTSNINKIELLEHKLEIFENLSEIINTITSLFGESPNDFKKIIKEVDDNIVEFNDFIIENIKSLIEKINNIPDFVINTDPNSGWIASLITIIDQFDNTNVDSIGTKISYIPDKKHLMDFLNLTNSLLSVIKSINKFEAITEEQRDIINKNIEVFETIIDKFTVLDEDEQSLGAKIDNLQPIDFKKIDDLIKLIQKISELNKIKFVLNISEKTLDILSRIADPLKDFIEKLGSVKEEDIKKAKDTIKAFFTVVIGGAAILLGASLLISSLNLINITLFTITLSGFLWTISKLFISLSKTLKDSLKGVKDAILLIASCGAIMIFGAYIYDNLNIKSLIGFTFILSAFLLTISGIFILFNKSIKDSLKGTKDALLLVGACAAIMIIGSLIYNYIDHKSLFGFATELGAFMLLLSGTLWLINKVTKDNIKGAKNALIVVGMSAAILILGSLAHNYYKFTDAILFTIELGIFMGAMYFLFKLYGKHALRGMYKGAKRALVVVGMAAAILILGSLAHNYYSFNNAWKFVIELGTFLMTLGVLFWGIGKLLNSGIKRAKRLMNLIVYSSALMIAAQLLYNYLDTEKIFGFVLILGGFVIALAAVFWVAGQLMKKAFIGIALVILVTTLAGFILLLAGKLATDEIILQALKFGGAIALYVAIMGIVCGLLGLFSSEIIVGVILMAAIMVLTLIAVGVMELMYLVAKQEGFFDTILEGLKAMGAVFGSFCAVIAGLGALMLTGVGAAAFGAGVVALGILEGVIAAAAGVIWLIGKAVKSLQSVKADETAFKNMEDIIINFAKLVVLLIDKFPSNPLKIAKLVIVTDVVKKMSAAIGSMVKGIKEFVSIKIPTKFDTNGNAVDWVTIADEEFDTAKNNIVNILTCVIDAILHVAKDAKYKDLFEPGLIKDSKAMNAAKVAKQMGLAIGSIAKGVKEIALLSIPTGYDSNGKATGWVTVGQKEFDKVAINLAVLLTCVNNALLDVAKTHTHLFKDDIFTDSPAMNAAKVAKKMGEAIGSIAQGVKEISSLQFVKEYGPDGKPKSYIALGDDKEVFNRVSTNLKTLLECVNDSLLKVAKEKPELFDDSLFSDSPAMNAAKVAKKMGEAVGSIAIGVKEIAELKFPILHDENGKPIMWVSLADDPTIFDKVGQNIETVLTCIGNALVNTVKGNKELFNTGTFGTDSPAMQAAKAVMYMGMTLSMTAKTIAAYSEGKIPIYDKDGNIVEGKFIDMNLDDISKGDQGKTYKAIYAVLTCLGKSLVSIVKDPNNKEIFDTGFFGGDSPAIQAAKSINLIGDTLTKVLNIITKLSNIKTENFSTKLDNIRLNIQNALNSIIGIFQLFTKKNSDVETESVKGGWGGFVNTLSKTFGGEGKVFETNGSITEFINNNIKDIESAASAIKKFTSVISSLLNSLSTISTSYDKNKELLNLWKNSTTEQGTIINSPIVDTFDSILSTIKKLYNSIVSIDNISVSDLELRTKALDQLLEYYISTLEKFIKLGETSNLIGSEGYNILRDGILNIYNATRTIDNIENFKNHANDLEKYIQAINSIDLSRINSLRALVDSMNLLSMRLGNLDNLTEAISEKLSAVLLELVNQLRKAESTIKNAHELQEYRKKLIEESIDKVKALMDKPMTVEISQKSEDDLDSNKPTGYFDGNPIDSSAPQGTDTETNEDTSLNLENPENDKNNKQFKSNSGNLINEMNNGDILTMTEFKKLMEINMKGWGEK